MEGDNEDLERFQIWMRAEIENLGLVEGDHQDRRFLKRDLDLWWDLGGEGFMADDRLGLFLGFWNGSKGGF